ncbi:ATP-binding protein [Streptomyces sp. IB2014 016-6]|uniref:ATP-binding protein n=1 Tax=Streptomyces sp. IB2014 016-6 TaxID=2517818 RepID=UPI0016503A9F|nr:ATP-binding protein [Streptomyces sp. IB2014 016-6]
MTTVTNRDSPPGADAAGTPAAALVFGAEPRHVETARRVTAAVLSEAGVGDRDAIGTVQLLVSEIVTNAIVHGDANSVSFQVTYDAADGEVLIEVDDHSSGAPEVRESGPEDEGGRGMRLVAYFARDWGRRGTCTWCTVPVGPVSG